MRPKEYLHYRMRDFVLSAMVILTISQALIEQNDIAARI
jgi:hypothetical protein